MNKSTFNDILKNLREENLAVFAGAGLSKPAGYVNWSELLEPIAEELDLDIDLETDLVTLAQYHVNENMNNRSKINSLLLEEFSRNTDITENHEILSRLPVSTYWTTNYDQLIERSLEQNGKNPDVKYTIEQLAQTKLNRDATVYKMHGDVNHPYDTIITRDDYESYYKDKEPFISGLAGDLITKTFLFIGFSFTDPNLDYILSRVRTTFQNNQRRHYNFLRKVNIKDFENKADYEYKNKKQELFVKDLKRFNIQTIYVDNYDEITDYLRKLEQEVNRRTIFISGSAHEYGKWGREESEQFIHALSREVINFEFKITTGFGLGVGSAVVSGALESIYKDKNQTKDSLILRPFPQNEVGKEMWTQYRKDMINHSGISLFLFGNKKEDNQLKKAGGMVEEFELSKEKGLYIVPVGSTGYVAKSIHEEVIANFEEYYPDYKKNDELYNLLLSIGNEDILEENLINNIISILRVIS